MKKKKLKEYSVRVFQEEDVQKLPETEEEAIVITEHFEIETEGILVLNIYDRKDLEQSIYEPAYRLFQAKEDYIIQDLRQEKWRSCSLPYLFCKASYWQYYPWKHKVCFLDSQSENMVMDYFGEAESDYSALDLISWIQKDIIDRKREQRNKKIQERIDRRMEIVPPLNDAFVTWAEEEALYWSRFVFYEYFRKKQMRGWCTCCKQEVWIAKGTVRHNKIGICPACKKQVTFIASGRKPRQMWHFTYASKLEKADGKLLYREFFIQKDYRDIYPETWKYSCSEEIRIFLDTDGNVESYRRMCGYGDRKDWHKSKKENTHGTILYPNGIQEAVSDTAYRYCALEDYLKHDLTENVYVVGYLRAYLKLPALEYFVKAGLYKMVHDFSEYPYRTEYLADGKDLKSILQIKTAQELELVRSNMVGIIEFKKAQKYLDAGVELTNNELLHCFYMYGSDDQLLHDNKYLPLRKLTSYIAKQVDRFGTCAGYRLNQDTRWLNNQVWREHIRFLGIWRDYVRFMGELDYELTGENMLCPYNLQKEHDRVYAEYQKMLDKKAQAERRKKDRKLKKQLVRERELLEGKIKNKRFQLVVPKSAADIRKEGRLLGHCVGSYTDSVLSGNCQIYFIRKREDLETPYYTAEWSKGKIVQCRGKKNCGYNDEMDRFLKAAERKVNSLKQLSERAA
ncbi:MAG: PcfJ domain-containing protein [Frisingicoccus sp.]